MGCRRIVRRCCLLCSSLRAGYGVGRVFPRGVWRLVEHTAYHMYKIEDHFTIWLCCVGYLGVRHGVRYGGVGELKHVIGVSWHLENDLLMTSIVVVK